LANAVMCSGSRIVRCAPRGTRRRSAWSRRVGLMVRRRGFQRGQDSGNLRGRWRRLGRRPASRGLYFIGGHRRAARRGTPPSQACCYSANLPRRQPDTNRHQRVASRAARSGLLSRRRPRRRSSRRHRRHMRRRSGNGRILGHRTYRSPACNGTRPRSCRPSRRASSPVSPDHRW
jgi:hypothetical protein